MTKRLFPSFPFSPEEAETANPELATFCLRFGGLAFILNAESDLPQDFLDELKLQGYSSDEIVFYRRLIESQPRESLLLSLACLGLLVGSTDDRLMKAVYEGYFFNLSSERKAHEISFDEIADAAAQIAPLFAVA